VSIDLDGGILFKPCLISDVGNYDFHHLFRFSLWFGDAQQVTTTITRNAAKTFTIEQL